jgi:hypothetical protein
MHITWRIEDAFTIELAWDGKDLGYTGSVEAANVSGPGSVIEPICVAPSNAFDGLVAPDGE